MLSIPPLIFLFRLIGVWQWVYKVTQQYIEELKVFKGCDGWKEEQEQLSVIMCQIQTALQATGEKLDQGPKLLDYPGVKQTITLIVILAKVVPIIG